MRGGYSFCGTGSFPTIRRAGRSGRPPRHDVEQSQGEGVAVAQIGQEPLDCPVSGLPFGPFHRAGVIYQQYHLPGHPPAGVADRRRGHQHQEVDLRGGRVVVSKR